MSCRCLAAISLDPRGGGVASASRLMWQAIEDEWRHGARLVTLGDSHPSDPGTLQKLRFGATLAKAQALGECRWLFYSHVGVAQVQRYLPHQRLQRPYGVFLHGIEVWGPLNDSQEHVLRGAQLLVANSIHTANRVRHAHPWIGDIHVCPLALLSPSPKPLREEVIDGIGPHAVLIVGRLDASERYKGHDELLESWPAVVRGVPDAQLIVVGAGDDEERLKQRAAPLGPSVRFIGYQSPDALRSLYERAAVFAMPSRNEGFGLVYIEAMAYGLPCLAATDDAAGEVVVDGDTGFLVSQRDVTAIGDRLVTLLRDRNLRQSMGAAGQRRVQERFSYGRFRRDFVSLLGALEMHRTDAATAAASR